MLKSSFSSAIQGIHHDPDRLIRYYDLVFEGVNLEARRLLDVGGGAGFLSFYAADRGASVVCLEPTADGAAAHLPETYKQLEACLIGADVQLDRRMIEDFDPNDVDPFDVVLLHNVVNHLDEDACARLHHDPSVNAVFDRYFEKLRELTSVGGHIIVADCSRRNIFGDIGIKNPFAPTIDWKVHQQPSVWAGFLTAAGFKVESVRWDAPSRFGRTGKLVLGNALGAWLTRSHFIITATRAR